ncbi:hypothetical protein Tco_1099741, partial [Tanacetum coccineum]
VPEKGKEKVGEEKAAQVLLHLQTTKKKSPTEYDTESDKEMPSLVRSGTKDEGQAGPDPGTLDEGQAGPNPDDVAESQPLLSHPAKAESRGETSWISLQHNGVYY